MRGKKKRNNSHKKHFFKMPGAGPMSEGITAPLLPLPCASDLINPRAGAVVPGWLWHGGRHCAAVPSPAVTGNKQRSAMERLFLPAVTIFYFCEHLPLLVYLPFCPLLLFLFHGLNIYISPRGQITLFTYPRLY